LDIFGGLSREEYIQAHVHRRLHADAASLSDTELFDFGKLKFNEQFPAIGESKHGRATSGSDLFGEAGGRHEYIQQKVHRKLHDQVRELSDRDIFDLGQKKFNDQFPFVDDLLSERIFNSSDGRQGYMMQRVHKRLHEQAASLSAPDLHQLGQMSFNDQFPYMEKLGFQKAGKHDAQEAPPRMLRPMVTRPGKAVDLFEGLGREQYMRKHVHLKLHSLADGLDDEDLSALGQLTFNAQFPFFNLDPDQAAAASSRGGRHGDRARASKQTDFEGMDRETFLQQRVHRKLHDYAAVLSDEDLLDFGKRKFNDQFLMLEQVAQPTSDSGGATFDGMSRDEFMQRRVHRKLHMKAASYSDEELIELGRLKFNDQFKVFDDIAEWSGSTDVFGGVSRDDYMRGRIHRRLHSDCVRLSDEALAELGKLSFNQQFHEIEHMAPEDASGLFGRDGRDDYINKRVHRKLHGEAANMTDEEVFELGKQSFNQQFQSLGHPP
jgi:hypothetical protein